MMMVATQSATAADQVRVEKDPTCLVLSVGPGAFN